jgi:hypothetical protein
VTKSRPGTHITRIALTVSVTLTALSASTARTSATPHVKGALRDPEVLQEQVIRLFDRLDHVSRVIDRVLTKSAAVEDRISDLSRQIDARQRLLNRRAAEAYMAGRAGGIGSVLGASSFTDLEDALAFLDAVSEKDHDLLVSLQQRKTALELERLRLEALEEELRRKRRWLDATASDLVEGLHLQRALLERAGAESSPDGPVAGSADPTRVPGPSLASPIPGREAVMDLIRERFAPLGTRTTRVALCIADAESGFDPLAVNPATGAAGVFQFLASTWGSLSELAGWPRASVFDAQANASVAAWTVAHYGWHHWRSVAAGCRA